MVFTIQNALNQWAQLGVFDYLLPFILIFALVYGVLSSTKILGKDNKGVAVVVAIVVALLSLQFGFVQTAFNGLFPMLGVGLAIVLVGMILISLFIPDDESRYWIGYGFGGFAVVVFGFIMYHLAQDQGWIGYGAISYYIAQYTGIVLLLIIAIVVIIAVAVSKAAPKKKNPTDGMFIPLSLGNR